MKAVDYLYNIAQRYDCQTFVEETETVKLSPSVQGNTDKFWCDFWKRIAEYYGKKVVK